jgi:hypothetical protein
MHTFADLAKTLNRSTVYLSGLQSRFEIPTFDGAGYSEAYLAFLQTVVHLRTHREEAFGAAPCRLDRITHLVSRFLRCHHQSEATPAVD